MWNAVVLLSMYCVVNCYIIKWNEFIEQIAITFITLICSVYNMKIWLIVVYVKKFEQGPQVF